MKKMGNFEKVEWESEEEWQLELEAFRWANEESLPEEVQKLIANLWFQYCEAAKPPEGDAELRELV